MISQAKTKIITITLEGVILDTREFVKNIIVERFDKNFQLPHETCNVYEIVRSIDNPLLFIEKFTEERQWLNVPVVPGSKESLSHLKQQGYKIFLISQMEKHIQNDLEAKLKEYGLDFDALIATGLPQLNQNNLNYYFDILKPNLWIFSNLSTSGGVSNKASQFHYVSNVPEEQNPNKKHSQADTLWQHISKRNIK